MCVIKKDEGHINMRPVNFDPSSNLLYHNQLCNSESAPRYPFVEQKYPGTLGNKVSHMVCLDF